MVHKSIWLPLALGRPIVFLFVKLRDYLMRLPMLWVSHFHFFRWLETFTSCCNYYFHETGLSHVIQSTEYSLQSFPSTSGYNVIVNAKANCRQIWIWTPPLWLAISEPHFQWTKKRMHLICLPFDFISIDSVGRMFISVIGLKLHEF